VVEAAFWFHPVVWWMERRLVEERERACDEAVVQLGGEPGSYAEGLLKACRFCVESPLVCVSGITGASLNRRIVFLMTKQFAGKLGPTARLHSDFALWQRLRARSCSDWLVQRKSCRRAVM
jgi:bla regulator protein blaR1